MVFCLQLVEQFSLRSDMILCQGTTALHLGTSIAVCCAVNWVYRVSVYVVVYMYVYMYMFGHMYVCVCTCMCVCMCAFFFRARPISGLSHQWR